MNDWYVANQNANTHIHVVFVLLNFFLLRFLRSIHHFKIVH